MTDYALARRIGDGKPESGLRLSKALNDGKMEDEPAPEEVRAAASVLNVPGKSVSSIRLPGPLEAPESVITHTPGMLPVISGFDSPTLFALIWDGANGSHPAALYGSPESALLIVSHESGPLVFFPWLEAAAAGTAVLQAAYLVIRHISHRTSSKARARGYAECIRRVFDEDGRVLSEETIRISTDADP